MAKFRIIEIRTEFLPGMLEAGFNGIFVVEPAALPARRAGRRAGPLAEPRRDEGSGRGVGGPRWSVC
jgi:hypothetical protein